MKNLWIFVGGHTMLDYSVFWGLLRLFLSLVYKMEVFVRHATVTHCKQAHDTVRKRNRRQKAIKVKQPALSFSVRNGAKYCV